MLLAFYKIFAPGALLAFYAQITSLLAYPDPKMDYPRSHRISYMWYAMDGPVCEAYLFCASDLPWSGILLAVPVVCTVASQFLYSIK